MKLLIIGSILMSIVICIQTGEFHRFFEALMYSALYFGGLIYGVTAIIWIVDKVVGKFPFIGTILKALFWIIGLYSILFRGRL